MARTALLSVVPFDNPKSNFEAGTTVRALTDAFPAWCYLGKPFSPERTFLRVTSLVSGHCDDGADLEFEVNLS
jgi:hypothetical protein